MTYCNKKKKKEATEITFDTLDYSFSTYLYNKHTYTPNFVEAKSVLDLYFENEAIIPMMKTLTAPELRLLTLKFVEGLRHKEIAIRTNTTKAAVDRECQKIMTKLKKELRNNGGF